MWNAYNRVHTPSLCRDSTNSWNYTTLTWRSANNNTANRVTFIRGLNEDAINVVATNAAGNANAVTVYCGIGIDSTSAFSGVTGSNYTNTLSIYSAATAHYSGLPGLGSHYAQRLEASTATGTTTWYGDDGGSFVQSGMTLTQMM